MKVFGGCFYFKWRKKNGPVEKKKEKQKKKWLVSDVVSISSIDDGMIFNLSDVSYIAMATMTSHNWILYFYKFKMEYSGNFFLFGLKYFFLLMNVWKLWFFNPPCFMVTPKDIY